MIDIMNEKLIRLEDLRDYLPSSRKGKKLGKAICFRWAGRGVRGVVLETIRVGGARLTSVEAIQRFVDAQNQAPGRTSNTTCTKAQTLAKKAGEELADRGI
jgi:hypothetical protein